MKDKEFIEKVLFLNTVHTSTEKAIEVLQSHKSHWERLLREKICDKTEGTDFINAVDMAISALQENPKLIKEAERWQAHIEDEVANEW